MEELAHLEAVEQLQLGKLKYGKELRIICDRLQVYLCIVSSQFLRMSACRAYAVSSVARLKAANSARVQQC